MTNERMRDPQIRSSRAICHLSFAIWSFVICKILLGVLRVSAVRFFGCGWAALCSSVFIGGFVWAQLFPRDGVQQLEDPVAHFRGGFSSAETKPFNLEPALIEGRVLVSGTWDEVVFFGVSFQDFVRGFQKGTGRP